MKLIYIGTFLLYAIGATGQVRLSGNQALRVMTFNLWHGGDGCGLSKDSSVQMQLAAIRKAKADVVGFQEQTDNSSGARAKLLADSLHWNYYQISSSRAVISRMTMEPINVIEQQPDSHHGAAGNNAQAVLIHLDNKQVVVFGVMHLMYTPYEPYDIADKKLTTAAQAEASAKKARLHEVQFMIKEVKPYLQKNIPVILVGDFNEPGYMDWTEKAIKERNNDELTFAVNWPASRLLAVNGFEDAYRKIYPSVKLKPGYTWTTRPGLWRKPEIYDRIDLIHTTKKNIKVSGAWIVGEQSSFSDIVVEPWPSDHRAVVTELIIPIAKKK